VSSTSDIADASPPSKDRRWMTLVVLCVGALMIVLDATIVNVALPTIKEDLGFSQSNLAWVVNAYLITFGGLLLLAGRLGDLLGRRNVFLAGLALFGLASVFCGMAESPGVLVGARFAQGVGGAMTSAVILGMIVTMFPERREQAKAIGVYSFVASAGGSIGLLLGGVVTEAINWHWIFFVNVPIAAVTGFFSLRLLEADHGIGFGRGADLPGAVLIVVALMTSVYTIVEAGAYGWASAHTLGFGVAAGVLFGAFVAREMLTDNPLVPLRIFRSRNLSGANAIQALIFVDMFGMFFLGALYMERVLGYTALEIGLAYLPMSTIIGTFSLGFSARLNLHFGARATLIPGLLLVGVGMFWFSRIPVDGTYVTDLLPPMVLMGTGAGLSFPSLMTLGMSDVRRGEAGLASGLINTSLQVGGALGLAVLVTLSTDRTNHLLATGKPVPDALTGGYRLALLVGAALMLVAMAIAVSVLRVAAHPQEGGDDAPAAPPSSTEAT
jgi:EmrB/QacA subfamily drug resistance transporter